MRNDTRVLPRLGAAALSLLVLAGCAGDAPLNPGAPGDGPLPGRRALGLVEVTISGLGDGLEPTATVLSAASVAELEQLRGGASAGSSASLALLPPASQDEGGDGTIQLKLLSTGSFTEGVRGAGGVRYVWASYQVRNAQRNRTAYDTPRRNLTFLGVDTDQTVGATAISRLNLFDNSPGDAALAAALAPTGAVELDQLTGSITSSGPDVLQVFTEAEVATVARPAGVHDVFPYGFVVRRAGSNATRTLPASPEADAFDGIVTFAFQVPLQATAQDDPFTISFMALAVDDDDTRITQAPEEQGAAAQAAFQTRAGQLGASTLSLLPGSAYTGAGVRLLCSVRTAGPKAAPAAYLGTLGASLLSLSPNPHSVAGSLLARNAQISATFQDVVAGVTPANLIVRGTQSGTAFRGQTYSGNGTATITTPAGSFFPGEEVDVQVTSGIPCLTAPYTARLRVASAPAVATFRTNRTVATGSDVSAVVPGDMNGDGKLDLVVATSGASLITVILNNGDLSAPTVKTTSVGVTNVSVALGDMNGDGKLDVVVTSHSDGVSVLLGNGDGTFAPRVNYVVGTDPVFVALGDLDGDGHLDVVTANSSDDISVLLGNGNGTLRSAVHYAAEGDRFFVGLADLNGDGKLDLVTANYADTTVTLRLGDGQGGFGPAQSLAVGANPVGIAIADLNGDGKLDLAVGNSKDFTGGDSSISLLFGNGDGTFVNQGEITLTNQEGAGHLAAGDLDGDGDIDLAVTNLLSETVVTLMNNGSGSFQPYAILPFPMAYNVSLGDLNGDGKLDIAAASYTYTGNATVFWNP